MKRILTIALVFALLCSLCLTVLAEDPHASHFGAIKNNYTVDGAVSGVTANVITMEFNPNGENGLVPLAYSGDAGSVCLLKDHVAAAEADGYEVVGAINASFFDMNAGAPCGILVTNGKLVFAHSGRSESIATFDADGKMNVVTSKLVFGLKINNSSYDNAIGFINKDYDSINDIAKKLKGHFQYYDINAGDLADESVAGIEIICEIKQGGYLAVGNTINAVVTEIKKDSYYGATKVTDAKQFVLFVAANELYYNRASAMKVDNTIEISVTESNPPAADALKTAVSAISSTYWLVKDGVDITDTSANIIHSTSLARAWTAFGVKEDGTYVYFVSEEYGLTLKDVADEMIRLGCKNVLRLDGGGSTGMYVKGEGIVMDTPRAICDALLIVTKRSVEANKVEIPETPESTEIPEETSQESETSEETATSEIEAVESSESVEEAEETEATEETDEGNGGIGSWIWIIIGVVLAIAGLTGYKITKNKPKNPENK